jgi:integrase
MPSKLRLLRCEIDKYLQELRELGRSERTLNDYRWALNHVFQGLIDAKKEYGPRKIGRKELKYLWEEYLTGSKGYKAHNIKILRLFLKWSGNTESEKFKLGIRDDVTRNVRWLEDEQAAALRFSAQGIERMIVHLELDLGLRRIEILRLKLDDFHTGRMNTILVHGKGANGGKYRQINWHPDTPGELEAYLDIRDREIARAKGKNVIVKIPDNLLIYEHGGRLRPYKKTAVDSFVKNAGKRIGVEVSNHDLRRTCGRMMFRAGVPIEHIARLFGHSDTKTTLHYLGLDYDDLGGAMRLYAQYQKNLICPEKGIFEPSQCFSGPNGI